MFSKNAGKPRYPASITKVMTLYLLFDALRDGKIRMSTKLTISANAASQSPTKLGLSEGRKISVADAIGAIVTKSANDIAVAVAEALAGSEREFAKRMTQKARSIGMMDTAFRNASGLPNSEQVTTAHDLIVLGRSILADHPERCKVFAAKYFQYRGHVYRNHNTMLNNYKGMEGMKTGFTRASGFNLLATARRRDKRLLAVVLGGASARARNRAMRRILNNAWPRAMTQAAARRARAAAAAAKPAQARRHKAKPSPEAAMREKHSLAGDEGASAAAPTSPPPLRPKLVFHGAYSRLKRRPDRASMSMLLHSIEAGLVTKAIAASYLEPPESSDTTTDEPEEKEAEEESQSPSYAPPPANEIVRNETIAAMTPPSPPDNLSVYNKSARPAEVAPLAAAALDMPPVELAPGKMVQSAPAGPPKAQAKKEEATQTLAVATPAPMPAPAPAPVPERPAQPGPFHIQAGAFPDVAQAKERIDLVRKALGASTLKRHPDFIMRITLPDGTTMYRARLGRFANKAQATAACRRLKKKGIDCWGVPVN